MITRIGMAPRLPHMSPQEALDHWRTSHADAAGAIPGLRRYIQLHPVLRDGRPLLPYPGFDACSLLDFDSVETMDAGFASPTYRSSVRDDEDRFVDKKRFSMALTERTTIVAPPEDGGAILAQFLRVHASSTPERLQAELRAAAEAHPASAGHVLHLPLPPDGRSPDTFDAVELRWYDTPDAALDWLLDPARGGAARLMLAGIVGTSEQLIATPYTVV
jgi:uncharacterized protein (TIGR02118 family)